MSKDAVIIGAGLGGLLCGRILSRKGWNVKVLEASDHPGGLLWPFIWDGIPCECGFHSVGGLNPGIQRWQESSSGFSKLMLPAMKSFFIIRME